MLLARKKIVDAKKALVLEILPSDVKRGLTKDPTACAAAIACIRQTNAISARVHVSRTYVEFEDKWVRYGSPVSLRTEIVSFDRGHEFEAGEYRLSPIVPSHTTEALKATQAQRKRGAGARPKRPKVKASRHFLKGVRARAHAI